MSAGQTPAAIPHRFKPGNPGKPPNSSPQMIRKMLDAMAFDPMMEAVLRYRDPNTPNASKDYCLGLITDRVLPKLKAVEVTGRIDDVRSLLIEVVGGKAAPAPVIEQDMSIDINDLDETVEDMEKSSLSE